MAEYTNASSRVSLRVLSINTQIPAVNLHPLSRRCTHSLSTALE